MANRFVIGVVLALALIGCSPKVLVDPGKPSPSPSAAVKPSSFVLPRGDGTDRPTQEQMQVFADRILEDVLKGDFPKGVLDDGTSVQAAFVNCDIGIGASNGQPFLIVSSAKQARAAERAFVKVNHPTISATAFKEVQPKAFIAVLVFASCKGHSGTTGPPK